MNLTRAQVARVILEFRATLSVAVHVGTAQQRLGQDGYALAFNERWLVPDFDHGGLRVTEDGSALQALQEAAASSYQVGDQVVVAEDGEAYAGVVKSTKNGKYVISFGDRKPRTQRPEYGEEELRKADAPPGPNANKSNNQPQVPGAPAPMSGGIPRLRASAAATLASTPL